MSMFSVYTMYRRHFVYNCYTRAMMSGAFGNIMLCIKQFGLLLYFNVHPIFYFAKYDSHMCEVAPVIAFNNVLHTICLNLAH